MKQLSIGKLRGLRQLANNRGALSVCAIDHRESLQQALGPHVGYQELVDFKCDLVGAVAPFVSAVLLDPVYGAAQAIDRGVLPGATGLLVGIEETGYDAAAVGRLTRLLPGWGVTKVKRLGASAVKLLVYLRTDLEAAEKQLDLVASVAEECLAEDIPLVVESVCYATEAEKGTPGLFQQKKPGLVVEAARRLSVLPIDILKTEFPADFDFETDPTVLADYCRRLDAASAVPWVLLSAGTDFERFRKELEIACQAGASGFMAGRALWQEATALESRAARQQFFHSETVTRLQTLSAIADRCATPWYVKMGSTDGQFADPPPGWYRNY